MAEAGLSGRRIYASLAPSRQRSKNGAGHRALTWRRLDPRRERDGIREIWLELSGSRPVSYFLSWGWVENWIDSLPEQAAVRLMAGYENDIPVIAFFAGRRRILRHGLISSRSLFMNSTGIRYFDRLCIEFNACLHRNPIRFEDVLHSLPDRWDEFHMPGLDPEAEPARSLVDASLPWQVVVESDSVSPYVDLEMVRRRQGDYPSLLSASTRARIKRSYRGYEARGPVALQIAGNTEQGMEIFEELIELHQRTRRARNQSGIFSSSYFSDFHRNLIRRRFGEGEIQLVRVSAGSFTVGCLYNFVFDKKTYFYQSGLNYEDDKRLKPGLISHSEAIKLNASLGNRFYDFLAGDTYYKRSLATNAGRIIGLKVQKPLLRFRLEDRLRSVKHAIASGLEH